MASKNYFLKMFLNLTIPLILVSCFVSPTKNENPGNSGDTNNSETPVITPTISCTTSLSSLDFLLNSTSKFAQSVEVKGNLAYVGTEDSTNGLQIYDISNPSSLSLRGYFSTESGPAKINPAGQNGVLDISISEDGNTAYLATYRGGLVIVNIVDPDAITYIGGVDISDEAWDVEVKGNHAFVVGYGATGSMYSVDISVPSVPVIVDTLAVPGAHGDLQIFGNYAYLSSWTAINIIDISDPTNLVQKGSLSISGDTILRSWLSLDATYMYALKKDAKEILVIDTSDKTSPTIVDTNPNLFGETPRSILGIGDKLYVGSGSGTTGKVLVYDISTPNKTVYIDSVSAANRVYAMAYKDGNIYTANGGGKGMGSIKVCE